MYGLISFQTKDRGSFATFGIGSTVGEEWLFHKDFHKRYPPFLNIYRFSKENCYSKNVSCVLEVSSKAYESLISILTEMGLKKDLTIIEA